MNNPITITPEVLENKIYLIRCQKVMLGTDLASLYGVPTKRLNEQVRRNITRFPHDFAFGLTDQEEISLRSQFATLENAQGSRRGKYSKYPTLVFTE